MLKSLAVALAILVSGVCFADTVYITEYKFNPTVTYQAAWTPAVANQAIAITGGSTQSAAFNQLTYMVRIHVDAPCSIAMGGTNPTATTSIAKFETGATEYFLVQPGDKLAVIANP